MQHLSRQLTKGIVMKTVGEFKKAGLEFVGDDVYEEKSFRDMCIEPYFAELLNKKYDRHSHWGDVLIKEFAWRENTGVKPEFNGLVEIEDCEGHKDVLYPKDIIWNHKHKGRLSCKKWRPSLNQPSTAESDTKQSAIHKAWVDLKGDIGFIKGTASIGYDSISMCNESRTDVYEPLCKGEYHFTSRFPSKDVFSVICTVKEFNDYCEKMAAEEKRMDIIGQNGNDGLQYGKTAQQVEVIVNNNTPFSIELAEKGGFSYEFKAAKSNEKPIFTQEMADAGELPPVGSMCMSEYPEGVWNEVKYMGKGIGGLHVLSYLNGSVDQLGSLIKFKPINTRTDREKAIDAAMTDIGAEHGDRARVEGVVERMIAAGYRKC